MATQAERLEQGGKLDEHLQSAYDEVDETAERGDDYAYRFEKFEDGSAVAFFKISAGQPVQIKAFESMNEIGRWHPVLDLEARNAPDEPEE